MTNENCTKLLLTNTSYNQPLPGLLDISRSEVDVREIMDLLNLENNKQHTPSAYSLTCLCERVVSSVLF